MLCKCRDIGLVRVCLAIGCIGGILYVVQLVAKCGQLLRMAVDIGLGCLNSSCNFVDVLLQLRYALGVLAHINGNINSATCGYPVTAFANIRSERR